MCSATEFTREHVSISGAERGAVRRERAEGAEPHGLGPGRSRAPPAFLAVNRFGRTHKRERGGERRKERRKRRTEERVCVWRLPAGAAGAHRPASARFTQSGQGMSRSASSTRLAVTIRAPWAFFTSVHTLLMVQFGDHLYVPSLLPFFFTPLGPCALRTPGDDAEECRGHAAARRPVRRPRATATGSQQSLLRDCFIPCFPRCGNPLDAAGRWTRTILDRRCHSSFSTSSYAEGKGARPPRPPAARR